jgi:hypothetical protein
MYHICSSCGFNRVAQMLNTSGRSEAVLCSAAGLLAVELRFRPNTGHVEVVREIDKAPVLITGLLALQRLDCFSQYSVVGPPLGEKEGGIHCLAR